MTEPGLSDAASGGARETKDSLALRVLSSLVLIPVTIGAVWVGGPVFAGLVAFLVVIMSFEWTRMIENREFTPVFYVLALFGSLAMTLAAGGLDKWAFLLVLAGAVAAFLAVQIGGADETVSRKFDRKSTGLWAAFGAFYFIAPAIALLWLRESAEGGRSIVIMLFFIVWMADSGAYFAGKVVGGPKLAPTLSPSKTWAGAVGGLILGSVAGAISSRFVADANILTYFLIGAGLGLTSIVGDMLESAIKRRFGVKDMSGLIPGHGGALDRLDGMILATTIASGVLFLQLVAG